MTGYCRDIKGRQATSFPQIIAKPSKTLMRGPLPASRLFPSILRRIEVSNTLKVPLPSYP